MSHNNNNDDEDTANAAAAADDDDDGLDHHSRNIKINVASFGRLVHLLASASPDIYTHQRRIACMEDANKAVIESVECREFSYALSRHQMLFQTCLSTFDSTRIACNESIFPHSCCQYLYTGTTKDGTRLDQISLFSFESSLF